MRFFWLAILLAGTLAQADDLMIYGPEQDPLPIVLAPGADDETVAAVEMLQRFLLQMSGRKSALLETPPASGSAIWVGAHPQLATAMPGLDTSFEHPEEILIACDGEHLALLGRDRRVGDKQLEYGTANAVFAFIQDYLGVRWLMPWPHDLWLDVPEQASFQLPVTHYRFHPPFRDRLFWGSRPIYWNRLQRLHLDSLTYSGGHAFTDWWERFHEEHPEWFAWRSEEAGRSAPFWGGTPKPSAVKLCVSNPEIAQQWLEDAEAKAKADPTLLTISASPNDGGGFCACEQCRAWDHPGSGFAGADRYVRFWNILARGLRERFPDRELFVGAYAYSSYRNPPVEQELEPNIAIGYVGHFPLAGDAATAAEKEAWLGWADKATAMIFRPNLFHYSGGWLGLPTVAMRRTMRDFRFLAENQCIGLQVDTLPHNFPAQGVQYYLMAQLAYNPYQDGEAILADFFKRGFGAAAEPVAAYFDLMEEVHEQILAHENFVHSSARAPQLVEICQELYTAEVMAQGEAHLSQAARLLTDEPEVYRQRLMVIRDAFEFAKLQVRIMHVMAEVRESAGKDAEAVRLAIELCERRDALIKQGRGHFRAFYHKRVPDHMGPPSDEFRQAAGLPVAEE